MGQSEEVCIYLHYPGTPRVQILHGTGLLKRSCSIPAGCCGMCSTVL